MPAIRKLYGEASGSWHKPFACDDPNCSSRFTRKSDLVRHKMTHSPERPFKCVVEGCEYGTRQRANLKVHEERKHALVRSYHLCPELGCDFTTLDQTTLCRHKKRFHSKKENAKGTSAIAIPVVPSIAVLGKGYLRYPASSIRGFSEPRTFTVRRNNLSSSSPANEHSYPFSHPPENPFPLPLAPQYDTGALASSSSGIQQRLCPTVNGFPLHQVNQYNTGGASSSSGLLQPLLPTVTDSPLPPVTQYDTDVRDSSSSGFQQLSRPTVNGFPLHQVNQYNAGARVSSSSGLQQPLLPTVNDSPLPPVTQYDTGARASSSSGFQQPLLPIANGFPLRPITQYHTGPQGSSLSGFQQPLLPTVNDFPLPPVTQYNTGARDSSSSGSQQPVIPATVHGSGINDGSLQYHRATPTHTFVQGSSSSNQAKGPKRDRFRGCTILSWHPKQRHSLTYPSFDWPAVPSMIPTLNEPARKPDTDTSVEAETIYWW